MRDRRDFPIRVFRDGEEWRVDWARVVGEPFVEPFFDAAVTRFLTHPFNLAFRTTTSLAELVEREERVPGLAPSGFVFHLSRCGSTLVSQAFASLDSCVAISEPNPVDELLKAFRLSPLASDEDRIRALRAIVGAYGRRWRGEERMFVIKLDSWIASDISLFERAFPDTPWIFVVRDPIEVMVSHARVASYMMFAGNAPATLGISLAEAVAIPEVEFHARVLGRVCDAALAQMSDRGLIVTYKELPDAIFSRIVPHFGVALDSGERDAMRAAFSRNAKRPSQPFQSDVAQKHVDATEEQRDAVRRWIAPAYEALEVRRLAL